MGNGAKNRGALHSSLYKDNQESDKDEQYDTAIQTLRDIQGFMRDMCHRGPIGVEMDITGGKRADRDNVFKACADAMQGIVYKNDKQIKRGVFNDTDYEYG